MAKDADQHTLKLLENSNFFATYSDAFEQVTGYALSLTTGVFGGEISFPILVGKRHLGFLVGKKSSSEVMEAPLDLLHSFTLQLGQEINRIILDEANCACTPIQSALKHLRVNVGNKISLDEVAREVEVCPYKLSRMFKELIGVTMTEYLGRLRVELARGRLSDPSRSVEEIAQEVGFGSISQFSRTFQKYSGESPTEYRGALLKLESYQLLPS